MFATAFLLGMMMTNAVGTSPSAASNHPGVPVLHAGSGEALVVVCDYGKVMVIPLKSAERAVQLNCLRGKMVVVRDYNALMENAPDFHPMQTDF